MPAPIAPSRSSSSNRTCSCAFATAARPPASARSLVPGILPITRFPQMLRFAERCGATVPDWLRLRFDGLEDDADTRRMIAAAFAIEQVEALSREGVDEFHFYTLNRADLTYAICHALGVRPAQVEPPLPTLLEHAHEPRATHRANSNACWASASWCSTAPWAR